MNISFNKIVFFRVEWLPKYEGEKKLKNEYRSPYGQQNGEVCEENNFLKCGKKYYGFVESGWNNGTKKNINLENLGGKKDDTKIDNILVVWIATKKEGGTYIVGWYKNAMVYSFDKEKSADHYYNVVANISDSILIPDKRRDFKIKGFGTSYLWYADGSKGKQLKTDVLRYIRDYKPSKLN